MQAPATSSKSSPASGLISERDQLLRAERAYEVGDFAEVRHATQALQASADAQLAAAARALRARTEVDAHSVLALSLALGVFCVIVFAYVL